ncbi:SWIM zinc finger family protein [Nocardia sp. CNY236]|uniref:SWIM zinc finger family protein n=1 Tax=Nocardia sp. CNY236 TaxID=1169152 RepID=UPI00041DCC55|nr:SWIM zinc finger family protein [Nocardia sp. CNY236]
MRPWTEDQIERVAPDAKSLVAAGKLAGRWRDSGHHDSALWGRCAGSGATVYQTVVDLSGPAYRCSCPSRKIPCKHALSLLLRWSKGEVASVAEAADYATSWIDERAARAARAVVPRVRTPSATTAQQRRARVGAGLDELDQWLADQVRTGLAQNDHSFSAFDAIAARMVDAQAPNLASALRRLPTVIATRPDWPDIVLGEYAWMHLLITAHRQRDAAAPALCASIDSHIGYPTPVETVRAEPAVRDHWMVVGLQITMQERLYTRRTGLYGRVSGRWAVIIDHSFGSADFPTQPAALGHVIDAQLHFYPSAAPLRALWGTHYGTAETFTAIHTATNRPATIATALAEHAAALGADPWLRTWPVLLAEVVPTCTDQGWYVTDPGGEALPIRPTEQPWSLLSVSGGHPVTVVGEWTAEGLSPVSVFAEGELIDLARNDSSRGAGSPAPTSGARNRELTSVALLGTARRAPDLATMAPIAAAAAAQLSTDPALRLLESVALDDLFLRGGITPVPACTPEPAASDPRQRLPRPAATRLAGMLGFDHSGLRFLNEWLAAAAVHDYRAPDDLCDLLLDNAEIHTSQREPLLRLAGVRGAWLASQHPVWQSSTQAEPCTDTWQFGRPPQRRNWLGELRRRDPEAARTRLTEAWPKESGPAKAELLAVLTDGLTLADEPLLEIALDDRRPDVRRTAVGLLARLPDSAFAQRMCARAHAWLHIDHRPPHTHMGVALPATVDAAARRDGITGREFAYNWDGAPDVTAKHLRQLVAATPLTHWAQALGTAAAAAKVVITDRFRGPVFDGWLDAALAHRDPEWARVLFAAGVPTDVALLRRRELFALLPMTERVEHLLHLDSTWISELEALLPAMGHPWPEPLAQHVLVLLVEQARSAARSGANLPRSLLTTAATHLPVATAGTLSAAARRCDDPDWESAFDQLANDLIYRSKMLEELQ